MADINLHLKNKLRQISEENDKNKMEITTLKRDYYKLSDIDSCQQQLRKEKLKLIADNEKLCNEVLMFKNSKDQDYKNLSILSGLNETNNKYKSPFIKNKISEIEGN